ncbi:hypothetical protein KAFR_0D03320 [Kazachstania africana CBS 2517]|uniref:Transcription factor BYE1 n=1 Tax=Kazachstania africana (strain ATCC 22294 / BCRC 22015 / CBS 2517 / CECT 1963 / NBRC 1671 / NRRL Y-8276) TaxID=1071382 RepID=H2AUD0_KAZAF|nr:hypothetical protein KAFR_0D03320 [Kazachstania africana CBS 2517]CCF57980.1 hypothetical protein KAFR_0D03320 [Kazachstania africana CBS 2517]
MPVRTSSRTNKGRSKYLQAELSEEEEEKGDAHGNSSNKHLNDTTDNVRCPVCGTNDANYDAENDPYGDMIQCDGCDAWQHINCMTGGKKDIKAFLDLDGKYFCEQCDPQRYPELKHRREPLKRKIEVAGDDKDEDFVDDPSQAHDGDLSFEENRTKRTVTLPSNAPQKRRRSSQKVDVTDQHDTNHRDDKIRQNASKMFTDLFKKYIIPATITSGDFLLPTSYSDDSFASEMASNLENELYKAWFNPEESKLSNYYAEKVRSIFSNLKDPKNLNLQAHVVNKDIPFEKLVRMSATELANPDLQQFKEKVNTESLSQLIIEKPDKPKYVKTHKGDELIEEFDGNENQEDVIYSRDNLQSHNTEELSQEKQMSTDSSASNPISERTNISDLTPQTKATIDESSSLINVSISYTEASISFSGFLKYLSTTMAIDDSIIREAFADGRLIIEGSLTASKGYEYLKQVQSSRAVLAYRLLPSTVEGRTPEFDFLVDSLYDGDRIMGVKLKQRYEKNIYFLSGKSNELPSIISDLFGDKISVASNIGGSDDKQIYVLVVVKPELILH